MLLSIWRCVKKLWAVPLPNTEGHAAVTGPSPAQFLDLGAIHTLDLIVSVVIAGTFSGW